MLEHRNSLLRLVGLGMVALLVGALALVGALYTQAFRSSVPVTLRADRAGLLMNPGNDVNLRGIEVGEVSAIEESADGALLTLALDPDKVGWVPADVQAEIVPTTAFGTKYVNLTLPDEPDRGSIQPGAVIDNRNVTAEVNHVFDNLAAVLDSIDVAKLNATLGVIAQALEGRGDQVATLAADTSAYLDRLNPSLPTLQRDLAAGAEVANLYADVSPDLLRVLDNATFTSGSIVDEAAALDSVLLDVTTMGTTTRQVLERNETRLVNLLDVLEPTTGLLREYSPGLTCFVRGLTELDTLLRDVIGGTNPGFNLDVSIAPVPGAYSYPEDLPEVAADNGPACHGLPRLDPSEIPTPYLNTDTGTDPFPRDDNRLRPGDRGVAPLLFGPLEEPGAAARAGEEGTP